MFHDSLGYISVCAMKLPQEAVIKTGIFWNWCLYRIVRNNLTFTSCQGTFILDVKRRSYRNTENYNLVYWDDNFSWGLFYSDTSMQIVAVISDYTNIKVVITYPYLTSMVIWVRSWNCGCLVTWFCYKLIAKPGNKTVAVPWPDPYD